LDALCFWMIATLIVDLAEVKSGAGMRMFVRPEAAWDKPLKNRR